jgi:hypothetical protein
METQKFFLKNRGAETPARRPRILSLVFFISACTYLFQIIGQKKVSVAALQDQKSLYYEGIARRS